MGKYPSLIIIARHGARLDVADSEWHLTSPTPYDPPLSYGGWLQSRSLGARIISLLRSSPSTENRPTSDSPSHEINGSDQANGLPPTSSRKHRIIIHTSPFLRCLQTAIAVSAGISQNSSPAAQAQPSPDKCLLRVDACLGEWLTPDYYEEITPPPTSDRMVAAAKAELIRRGEDIVVVDAAGSRSATGYFPGGWGSASTPVSPNAERTSQMSPMTSVQSNRNRAGSYDAVTNPRAKGVLTKLNTNLSNIHAGYVPPTPGYAISSSDPIPSGYVAHARDACTRIDYPWDSMRNPNWGDGGVYGEEWSTMHGRFRRGLMNMVDWYGDHGGQSQCNGTSQEDDETDTVLIVITHGAGCNALIGALTGEPVLVDVGTASLTMAAHREAEMEKSQSSDDLSHKYALKLVASADHLRPGANPSDISSLVSPKPPSSPSLPPYRHRIPSRPSFTQKPFIIGPSTTSSTPAWEWTRSRPSTAPRMSPGLWGQDGGADSGDEIVPNFDGPGSKRLPNGNSHPREDSVKKDLPQRTLSQRGLWGSAPLNKDREAGLKRRWTVTERRV